MQELKMEYEWGGLNFKLIRNGIKAVIFKSSRSYEVVFKVNGWIVVPHEDDFGGIAYCYTVEQNALDRFDEMETGKVKPKDRSQIPRLNPPPLK